MREHLVDRIDNLGHDGDIVGQLLARSKSVRSRESESSLGLEFPSNLRAATRLALIFLPRKPWPSGWGCYMSSCPNSSVLLCWSTRPIPERQVNLTKCTGSCTCPRIANSGPPRQYQPRHRGSLCHYCRRSCRRPVRRPNSLTADAFNLPTAAFRRLKKISGASRRGSLTFCNNFAICSFGAKT